MADAREGSGGYGRGSNPRRDDRGDGRGSRGGHDASRRDAKGRERSDARLRSAGHRSAAAPSERRRSGDPARTAALAVLRAVDDGAYANLEMPKVLRRHDLSGRDAAFATELALGTIRRQGLYDRVIEVGAGRAPADIDPIVLDILRLGVHQLLSMRVPTHAATSETVALAREHAGAGASGFVNAVLRRAGERDRDTWIAALTRGVEDADDVRAIATSHPAWVVSALRQALRGHEAAGGEGQPSLDDALDALLAADNEAPRVALVARPGLADVDELVEAGAELSDLSPIAATLPFGDPANIPAVRETRAAVQDEGSQLLAIALAEAPVEPAKPVETNDDAAGEGTTPIDDSATQAEDVENEASESDEQTAGASASTTTGEQWLDMCAGPGGKAAVLGSIAHLRGHVLFCNESSEHRTELVRRTLRALLDDGAEIYVGTGDGRELGSEEPATYDRVLLDAPCTGLGAMRRRPESRWRRRPFDVAELAALQVELLNSALDATRPGGIVGYATCSPHPAETIAVVGEVLGARDDVVQEDAWPYFLDAYDEPIERIGTLPSVQLWPHVHGTDAMFFALLRKTR